MPALRSVKNVEASKSESAGEVVPMPREIRRPRLRHLPRESIAFLKGIDANGIWSLKAIRPKREPKYEGQSEVHIGHFDNLSKQRTRDAVVQWVEAHAGWDVYYFVNELSREAVEAHRADFKTPMDTSAVANVRGVQLDIDPAHGEPFEEERDRLRTMMERLMVDQTMNHGTPPTATVFSGGGVQAFWFFRSKLPAAEAGADTYNASTGVRDAFDGGDNVQDLARVMRLPGTLNQQRGKKEGRPVAHATVIALGKPIDGPATLLERFPPKVVKSLDEIRRSVSARNFADLAAIVRAPEDAPELDKEAVRAFALSQVLAVAEMSRLETKHRNRREDVLAAAKTLGGLLWTGAFTAEEVVDPAGDDDGPGVSLVAAYEINGGTADNGFNGLDSGLLAAMSNGAREPLRKLPNPIASGDAFGAVDEDGDGVALSVAWTVYEAAVKAGTAPDASALLDALDEAGAPPAVVARLRTLVADVVDFLALDADTEATKALAEIGQHVAEVQRSTKKRGPVLKPLLQFLAEYVPPSYLVDHLLQRGYVYAVTGPTGAGKTPWLILLTLALVTGRADILGIEVERTRVAYATFENPPDFRVKLMAAMLAFDIDPVSVAEWLTIIDKRVTPKKIDTAVRKFGGVGLVTVDTLQAGFEGNDSNSNDQMKAYAAELRKIAEGPDRTAVMIAAHPVKRAEKNNLLPYGGGALLNEIDGNLTLWRDEGSNIATLHHQGKFRGVEFPPMSFRIDVRPFDQIADDRGRAMSLPVMRSASAEEAHRAEVKVETTRDTVLRTIAADPAATQAQIAERMGIAKGTISKAVKALLARKLIEKSDEGHAVTPAGREVVDAFTRGGGFGPVDKDDDETG